MGDKTRTTAILVFNKVGHVLLQNAKTPHDSGTGEVGCVGWSLRDGGDT